MAGYDERKRITGHRLTDGPRRGRRILEEGKRMLKAYVRDKFERTQ